MDPITLEIVKNALEALADEMALVVLRCAYSPIVRDSMDYSTAICDRLGRVIAQGLTNPIHLGSFPRVMAHLLERHKGDISEGDGFLVNDPYDAGGMHLPDIYFIKPVFATGRLAGFAAILVHHTDLGGMAAGSMAIHAVELFQEGLRIPLVKLYDKGRRNDAVEAFLKANSRVPQEVMGDLRAQISATEAGERGLAKLVQKYGHEAFDAMVEELHDYAERVVRQRVGAMPDGVYEAEDHIDGLGEGGSRIDFHVAITIEGDEIAFDWEGTSEQVAGSINGPITTTYSLAYAALRAALGPGIPNCEGYTRPVRVEAPLGSIVNPRPYAACAARGVIAYRMLDTCFAALAKVVPEAILAGGEGGPTAISFSGTNAQTHRRWLITDGILGSWGGRRELDGPEGISNPGANLSNQPIELIEARLPLRVERYGFAEDSGGAGRMRGGLAMVRSYRVLQDRTALTLRSDRRRNLPLPLDGGLPGSPSLSLVERPGGERRLLPVMPMESVTLNDGELFLHVAAGGAGYGDPLERDPQRVLEDVLDGKTSVEFALEIYGVVISSDVIDRPATEDLRGRMAAEPAGLRGERQKALFLKRFDLDPAELR